MPSRFPYAIKRGFRAAFTHPLLDARGRQVAQYNSRRRMFTNDPGDHFPQAEFERVYRRLFPRFSIRRSPVAQLIYGTICAFAAGVVFLTLPAPYRYALLPSGIIVALGAIFGAITTRRWFWGASCEAVAAALLGADRCPSCAYPLRDTPADADGLTTCPECGAAWRLPLNNPPPTPPL